MTELPQLTRLGGPAVIILFSLDLEDALENEYGSHQDRAPNRGNSFGRLRRCSLRNRFASYPARRDAHCAERQFQYHDRRSDQSRDLDFCIRWRFAVDSQFYEKKTTRVNAALRLSGRRSLF